jgi:Ca2+/Na+ antiporter
MAALASRLDRGIPAAGRAVLILLVFVTVLNYGSPGATERDVMALAFAVLTVASVFRPLSQAVFPIRAVATLLLAGLLIYVMAQLQPFAAGEAGKWAWDPLRAQLGQAQATISVAPGATRDALPALALPFLVFLSSLALFQGDAEALWLWRALAYFGAAEAVFGILQHVFFPDLVFLEQKRWYAGSLTATFINRNTAGTFLGLAFLLNLGLFFYYLRQIRLRQFGADIARFALTRLDALVIVHGALSFCVLVALFLTQSRGANAAGFLAGVMAFAWMARKRLTADRNSKAKGVGRGLARALLAVVALALVFELFAGRVAQRVEGQGAGDVRWCTFASAIEVAEQHPAFGAGFATFQDLFPTYRQSACSGIDGVWDRAHNFYLEGFLGLGAPFLVALIVGYGALVRTLAHGIGQRNQMRFIPVLTLAAIVLVSLHSLVDFSLQIPGVAVYFAAVLSAGVTISYARAPDGARKDAPAAARVRTSLAIPAE